jgi:hypothetical protein
MLKPTAKRIVKTIVNQNAFAPVAMPLLRVINYASRVGHNNNTVALNYDQPHRAEGVRLIHQIYAEREMLLSLPEAYSIFAAVQQTGKIPGDIAEVGVYQGGSSKLICEAKGARRFHLFDTFAGLPLPKDIDAPYFTEGKFACSLDSVRQYLSSYSGLSFYKGLFPETASPVSDCRFSLVSLDVDLYESTRSCLEFFFPRLSPGGVIISHDSYEGGVKAAFEEFLANRPELLIELVDRMCMVIKIA